MSSLTVHREAVFLLNLDMCCQECDGCRKAIIANTDCTMQLTIFVKVTLLTRVLFGVSHVELVKVSCFVEAMSGSTGQAMMCLFPSDVVVWVHQNHGTCLRSWECW
mgnify:CR=1 FL=1